MSRDTWTIVIWLLLGAELLALELSSIYLHAPWTTLSSFEWDLQEDAGRAGYAVALIVLVGLAVLLVHAVAHWPR